MLVGHRKEPHFLAGVEGQQEFYTMGLVKILLLYLLPGYWVVPNHFHVNWH